MKTWWAVLALVWAVAGAAIAQTAEEKFDPKKFQAFKKETLAKAAAGQWKKINWQPDLAAVLKAAKEQNKPILVALVVGHSGPKGAAEC